MTNQTSGSGLPTPPAIMDGNEVYDMLMAEIEPDLVTANLPTLQEKYKDESREEMQARAERYKAAFVEYKKRYAEYKAKQEEEVRSYGRDLMGAVEQKSEVRDAEALGDLESAISNS